MNVTCPLIICFWLIKKVSSINHNIIVLCFYCWKTRSLVTCSTIFIDFDKTILIAYLLLEKVDQLGNLNISFSPVFFFTFVWYLFQLTVLVKLFKKILVVQAVLHYPELIKLKSEHKVLYQLMQMLLFDWQQDALL